MAAIDYTTGKELLIAADAYPSKLEAERAREAYRRARLGCSARIVERWVKADRVAVQVFVLIVREGAPTPVAAEVR